MRQSHDPIKCRLFTGNLINQSDAFYNIQNFNAFALYNMLDILHFSGMMQKMHVLYMHMFLP